MDSTATRFEIERSLDGDGETQRFRAWDRERGAHVLLWLPADSAEHARIAEAHGSACVQRHPAALRMLASSDAGVEAPFVAFECIDGPLLSERLREGPLSVDDTEALAAALGDLLAQAHAAGIAHGAVLPCHVLLADGDAARAKLFGFGAAANADATVDALALARLVIACGDAAARRGSARSRGWDRVAELSSPLATFVRAALGERGEAPSSMAAHALEAWLRSPKRALVEAAPAAEQGRALLVANWHPPVEPLCELAAAREARTTVHADGTLSAVTRAQQPLVSQLQSLSQLARAWQQLRPDTRAVMCCEVPEDPSTADAFVRAMQRLGSSSDALALDDAAALRLRKVDVAGWTVAGGPGRYHALARSSDPLLRKAAIAAAVLLSVGALIASVWWLFT